jgi:hypothetical protein
MAAAVGDSVVAGLIVAAASWVVGILGVEPSTVFVAASACFLGSPFAAPSRNKLHALLLFGSSVVVTCHAAAGVATAFAVLWPDFAAHERRAQAAAAILVGIGLHIVVSHLPAILKTFGAWLAKRLGAEA